MKAMPLGVEDIGPASSHQIAGTPKPVRPSLVHSVHPRHDVGIVAQRRAAFGEETILIAG
jgi:hypothetical protein